MLLTLSTSRPNALHHMIVTWATGFAQSAARRSRAVIGYLERHISSLLWGWGLVAAGLGVFKVASAGEAAGDTGGALIALLPYLLIAISPACGFVVASGSFPRGLLAAPTSVRLCRYGSWRSLDVLSARTSPAFGPTGFMASLIVGIILNVPMRSLEFIVAIPSVSLAASGWAQQLFGVMAIDVIVMNFFYVVSFVMAIRSVPLFPRMLVFVWIADIAMQLIIARTACNAPNLPIPVASALHALLYGNIMKVLISACVWLPYLILSERVNVTFRHRMRG